MTAELRTACEAGECAWHVKSASAWNVSRLQMFTDRACETEVTGHSIAGSKGLDSDGCSGISVVGVENAEKWCGASGSWIGLYSSGLVKCVRVRGSSGLRDGLSLLYVDGLEWSAQATWLAHYEAGGNVAVELQVPCDKCAWRVTSTALAWSVLELRMFTDTDCTNEVGGHAIASANDCDGISKVSDGALGTDKWCGGSSDWVGLTFATPPTVRCAHASGDAHRSDARV